MTPLPPPLRRRRLWKLCFSKISLFLNIFSAVGHFILTIRSFFRIETNGNFHTIGIVSWGFAGSPLGSAGGPLGFVILFWPFAAVLPQQLLQDWNRWQFPYNIFSEGSKRPSKSRREKRAQWPLTPVKLGTLLRVIHILCKHICGLFERPLPLRWWHYIIGICWFK